jgi:cell wall-associated NlpC family hydrolase
MTAFDPRLTPARTDLAAAQLEGVVAAARYAPGRNRAITAAVADLRRSPSPDAPLDTQALHGESVTLYDEDAGWSWVQLARDGYVGYIASGALVEDALQATHRVAVNRTFVYPGPDLKQPVVDAFPRGARVHVRSIEGRFARIAEAGYVIADHLVPVDLASADFVAVAEQLLHAPYLWGGKTSLGIDCSGLVQLSLAEAGVLAPRDTDLQEQALGLDLAFDESLAGLRRGDLVFWPGHVGILRDETILLHANAHHMLVASEPLRDTRNRILATAGAPITAIKRI